jgi:hypothetical protein
MTPEPASGGTPDFVPMEKETCPTKCPDPAGSLVPNTQAGGTFAQMIAELFWKGGIAHVAWALGIRDTRAIYEVNRALNALNAGMDFSKYRERLPP